VDPDKCTGCRTCELVCSFDRFKVFDPYWARISVYRDERNGVFIPVVCMQCEVAPCMESCPSEALYRDEKTNAVVVNEDKCIGCRLCVNACPVGAIKIDPVSKVAFKCDLCGGDPKCVKHCRTNALTYEEEVKAAYRKARERSTRIIEAMGLSMG